MEPSHPKGHLPHMLPCPPQKVLEKLNNDTWTSCIQTWETLAQNYLALPKELFLTSINAVSPFLLSYLETMHRGYRDENHVQLSHAQSLHRGSFLLTHRIFHESAAPPAPFLHWQFLGDLCRVYRNNDATQEILRIAWTNHERNIEASLVQLRRDLMNQLERKDFSSIDIDLLSLRLLPLLQASPPAAAPFVTSTDFLDTIADVYSMLVDKLKATFLVLVYLSLSSLVAKSRPNPSLLLDILYQLKTDTEKTTGPDVESISLLSDLITDTPFLQQIRTRITGAEATRAQKLTVSLEPFRKGRKGRPETTKLAKGKQRKIEDNRHVASDNAHVHRMSLVSQVQDLFPDLGSGFIAKCLTEYNDDVEQVTAHLLDNTISAHLKDSDRSENLETPHRPAGDDLIPSLAPRATPPPSPPRERRNVFDGDEFDRLEIDTSRLHAGRKDAAATADGLLSNHTGEQRNANKAAIMAALAAFDADDDERDDTYDLEDVGRTVDSAQLGGADEASLTDDAREQSEEALLRAYSANQAVFARDAATRRGKERQALKGQTGLTDEAIEGWAVMVRRDPKRLRRLEAKHSASEGQQRELARTAWSGGAGAAGSGTEDSEASGPEGAGRARARGRGRGRGGSGRGGNVAGPSDDKATQVERHRKEANKGGRANHNRREQRAKKMARGGFAG